MNDKRVIFDIVEKAMSLIEKKAADYSEVSDPHSNFKYAALVAEPFPDEFKPYAMLIGVKLARLSQLLRWDREAKCEAIEDSFVDALNYVALMAERHQVDEMRLTLSASVDEVVRLESDIGRVKADIYCEKCYRDLDICTCPLPVVRESI